MKKKSIKGLLLTTIAALTLGLTSTSCVKEALIESVTTDYDNTFTITNDQWSPDSEGNLAYGFSWSPITNEVLNSGSVHVYKLTTRNGYEYQTPLPYVFPIDHVDTAGRTIYEAVNVCYELEPGYITFVLKDLGNYLTTNNQLLTMRFRVVVNTPITYIIEQ